MKKKLLTIVFMGMLLTTLTACDNKKEEDRVPERTPESAPAVETKYSVFIDYDNEKEMSELSVIEGKTLEEPDIPTKSGYTFVEWQVNGKKYDFSTPITKSIVIKATWKKKTTSSNNSSSSTSSTKPSTKPSTSTTKPSSGNSSTTSTPSTGNSSTATPEIKPTITSITGIGENYSKYNTVCKLNSLNASIEKSGNYLQLKYDYNMTKLEKDKIYTFCTAVMKVYDSTGVVVETEDLIIGDLEVGEQGHRSTSTYINSNDTKFTIKIVAK